MSSDGPSPLAGKNILVTGATGSFGHAFTRRALANGARRVVCYSRDELKQSQMRAEFTDPRMRFFLGDVRNVDRLIQAMNGVDVVIHAAALKRIEVCEANPSEAILTNIVGTQNTAEAAILAGVERAVLLSTDKAPHAHTLYGMTKAVAERAWVQSNVLAAGGPTRLSATRYGNVIGSRGSVLDLFRQQAAAGVPITITDLRCSRFWMTIEQAVELVLTALREMRGGEVFVPKCPSSPVTTLATAAVMDGPRQPPLFRAVVTGLRPGERVTETLISSDEARSTYDAGNHYIIEPESRTWGDAAELPYPKVAADWSYRSDTNPDQLSVNGLRALVAA